MFRGGSFYLDIRCLGVADRYHITPTNRYRHFGFRCVADVSVFSNSIIESELQKTTQKTIEWEKDNSQMALIPAGSFEMGDHLDNMSDALPIHTVILDGFYMDIHEVTVGQFKHFVNQSGYNYNRWNEVAQYSPGDNYPMVMVSWNDAVAYAEWAGKRLPTEAEWEYAARGGLVGQRYPWGHEITHDNANYSGTGGIDQWDKCSPVGSFSANGYGLYDMTGNVWEWCADWYGENYYNSSPAKNPLGPKTGKYRVQRGGRWYGQDLRLANRNGKGPGDGTGLGFRCVSGSN